MKLIATLLLAIVFIPGAYGQDDTRLSRDELKKLQREQRKAEQQEMLEQMKVLTETMVTQQHFVLEADYLSDKYGSRLPVQSTINFIVVDSLTGIFQFGSAMTAGYNGVGGATLEGKISNYKYVKVGKKKDSWSVSFNMMTSLGTYDFTLMITADGRADATIRGNWSGNLNYHGYLVPLEASRIYKGQSLY